MERLELISKYMGAPDGAAKLDRLGGASWGKVKESVRAALREMAEELLKLYAQRELAARPAFGPDAPWQREFEAAFRFEETPDQQKAIDEVKADMERERPMDRLVAGDVGYGKTEVALRAAFKAVTEGRQVAILVPTTVLAQQHFNTFSDRFEPYPAKVELLSRYRTPKEMKAVLAGLKSGAVDVVIGTHRLLSKDVEFKRLGLLVVDEEHRFGVTHKERIKQMRHAVDVLTLTATPIPRTLIHGDVRVRDLSVSRRLPSTATGETVVTRFSRGVIKEAIERELQSGGQVFFVHNRVQSLVSMTTFIKSLVPEARVVMAHGQMAGGGVEGRDGEVRGRHRPTSSSPPPCGVGLDIPPQHHSSTGRTGSAWPALSAPGAVGRGADAGPRYLMVPRTAPDETAQRRLQVIEELNDLGRDSSCPARPRDKGAGHLLWGPAARASCRGGVDLYTKLLEEAVRELRGEAAPPRWIPAITVESRPSAEAYVSEENQRLALYKRLAELAAPVNRRDAGGARRPVRTAAGGCGGVRMCRVARCRAPGRRGSGWRRRGSGAPDLRASTR